MSTPKEQAFEAVCSALYQMDSLGVDFLGEGDTEQGHTAFFVFRQDGQPVMEAQVTRHEPEEQISVLRRWRATTPDGQPGFVSVDGRFLTTDATAAALRTPTQEAVLAVLDSYRQVLGDFDPGE